ncbi:MAG: PAS sensor histidine kinase [halophilic archaeon J07HX64]|jgi:PAS domain S-box|nr:MAG: PAS sensor histidine kinase [halophilic archaeon J07HX64]
MSDSPRSGDRWDGQGEAGDVAIRLIESLRSHAIFTLDAEGKITTWPTPAAELYGHDAEAVLGEHLRVLLGGGVEEETVDDVAAILPEAGSGTVERKGWHERSDGSVFWGTLTLSPLRESESGGYGVVCRDTTATKGYQQMLERRNDRLKEFTDILAHDLRNPLSAIDQHLTLYEETGERTHIESIDQTTDRMSRLVEDLLRVAKQGDVVTDPEPTDVETVVRLAWTGTGDPADSLEYEVVPTVSADSDRLCELLENLLRNAVRHGATDNSTTVTNTRGDHGGGVTVRVGPLDNGFYVEDDGPGIADSIGTEVFDHGVTTTQDGSGYGLSIVQTIANAHGWDISLATAESGGARFEITGIEFLG